MFTQAPSQLTAWVTLPAVVHLYSMYETMPYIYSFTLENKHRLTWYRYESDLEFG